MSDGKQEPVRVEIGIPSQSVILSIESILCTPQYGDRLFTMTTRAGKNFPLPDGEYILAPAATHTCVENGELERDRDLIACVLLECENLDACDSDNHLADYMRAILSIVKPYEIEAEREAAK